MRCVARLGLEVGEGPFWDVLRQCWWFVDIRRHAVHSWEPRGNRHRVFAPGQQVSAVFACGKDRLLIAGRQQLFTCKPDGSQWAPFGSPLESGEFLELNDAKIDSRGRCWVGSLDRQRQHGGHLWRVEPDGSACAVLSGIQVSNGLAWSLDERTLYYIDSLSYQLRAYDFEVDSGDVGQMRVVAEFDPGEGLPDGIAVAGDGSIWVAMFGAGKLRRFDRDGTSMRSITVPTLNVTSLAFGGESGCDVLLTTGTYKLSAEQVAADPDAGAVFVMQAGQPGAPVHAFAASKP